MKVEVIIGAPQRGPYHLALRQASPGTFFAGILITLVLISTLARSHRLPCRHLQCRIAVCEDLIWEFRHNESMQHFFQALSCSYLAHHMLRNVSTMLIVILLLNTIALISFIKLLHSRDLHHQASGKHPDICKRAQNMCKHALQWAQKERQGSANQYKLLSASKHCNVQIELQAAAHSHSLCSEAELMYLSARALVCILASSAVRNKGSIKLTRCMQPTPTMMHLSARAQVSIVASSALSQKDSEELTKCVTFSSVCYQKEKP